MGFVKSLVLERHSSSKNTRGEFLRRFPFHLRSPDIGIDLGTAHTVFYVKGVGVTLNEASVIAFREEGGTLVRHTVGNDAKMMLGKTPSNINAMRPLKDGVIANFQGAEEMVKFFLRKACSRRALIGSRIVVCVPSGSTPVERRAIQEAVESVGAREVYLIEEPMAAAIGAGLPVTEPRGSMIVDIGGGTTEVAILSLSGIVCARSIRVGGDFMDSSIIRHVRHHRNLLIGESTAERIKKTVGSAVLLSEQHDNPTMTIKGRDLVNGVPVTISLSAEQIAESLQESVQHIVSAIQTVLETSPPELASDIAETGITLSGGGALLSGLGEAIRESTGLSVVIAEDPLFCVASGTGRVLENFSVFRHVLFQQD